MNGQRGQLSTLIGRTLLGLAATAVTAVLLAPTVAASPMGDAEDAMMAAWEKAGGDTSTLGVRKGDVYPIGDRFALDFAGGKVFSPRPPVPNTSTARSWTNTSRWAVQPTAIWDSRPSTRCPALPDPTVA